MAEDFVIAEAGKPTAKLVRLTGDEPSGAKRLGFLKGAFNVPDDFDRLGSSEIAQIFGEL